MGIVFANSKPEVDSFDYAYVETANGEFVRISLDNLKKALDMTSVIRNAEVALSVSDWVASSDGTYYTQEVAFDEISSYSKIDLQPTPEQIIQLMNEEITIFISNDNTNVTAYAVNGKPSTDMVIKAIITEVAE